MSRIDPMPPERGAPVSAGPAAPHRRLALKAGIAALAPWPAGVAAHRAATPARDALRVVGPWELSSLDPLRSGYLFSRMQVTETLVDYDAAGRPAPGLAAGWQVSADGLQWRFALQPGARFHDGTPVTAGHVVASLQRARHAAGVLRHAPIVAIEAHRSDLAALTVRLSRPHAPLPALLSHSSTQVLAPASFGPGGEVRAVIGSGPYRIDLLEPPQRFGIVAFEQWRGAMPAVRRAGYLSVGRAEMRALMAESGQADLAYGLDPGSIARLRRHPAVRLHEVTIPRTTLLKVNAGHPLLADPRARQALSLALDRRGIAGAILRDPGLAATQLFPDILDGWHVPTLPPLAHDVARASALLAQLGWRAGADGMLSRDGQPFAITLRTFPDRPELPVIATAIQEQWRLIGVRVRVAIGNSSDIPFAHRDGTLEVGLMARSYGVVPDALGTLAQDFAGRGGDWGAMNWSDARVSAALAALPGTMDPARAAALRSQVATTLQQALPLIPVVWYRQSLAASPALAGVSIDPFERSYRLTELQRLA
ncbi:ABC transporter substrate-binding protein [Cupriavidus respiraculi]|uniref:Nickel-binding periplasmic protein n=1 Tax=Cupriavidus respiraculi TaxID=195930 RepID=A0ABM8XH38_9BURK|nr:ABC transporter substrate-binding protein [Cupriavidus respiraculi]CAG9179277.1 Nickel-binding periplasmic protein [Cupriavidus respiraculi]